MTDHHYCPVQRVLFPWRFIAMSVLLLETPVFAVPAYRVVTLGLNDFEHTRNDGHKLSKVREWNSAGQVIGPSWRYNGGNTEIGRSAWLYDGVTTINLGLTGSEYTSNNGYEFAEAFDLNEAGQVIGRSQRYSGSTASGLSAWFYDGATTFDIGLVGPEYLRNEPIQLNEAGQVNGYSERYSGGGTHLGQSAWFYDGATTFDIGFIGLEHTRADGYKNSYGYQLNEAGQVRGISQRYNSGSANLGRSTWLYDGATTINIGLTGIEHTRNDGYKYSDYSDHYSLPWLNSKGQVSGYSLRFNGGGTNLGQSAWFYDGVTTVDIGLTGTEHTRNEGYKSSGAWYPNEAGQVLGGSNRFNGGSADMGYSAWLFDGEKTIDLSLTDAEHTRSDGYRSSSGIRLNEAGQVLGHSSRYHGGSVDLGRTMWFYDGVSTTNIGLTGPEHTRNDGYKDSSYSFLDVAGRVLGLSGRYNGGGTNLGLSAWLYDGFKTVQIGLTGSEHTRDDGYKESWFTERNEMGMTRGYSHRYNGGGTDLGRTAWLYNGVSTIDIGLTGPEHTRNDGYKDVDIYAGEMNDAGQVTGVSYRYNGGSTPMGQDAWLYDHVLGQTFSLQLSQRSDGYAYSTVAYLGKDGLALGTYILFDAFDNNLGARAYFFTVADGLHDLGSLVHGGLSAYGWESLAAAFLADRAGKVLGSGELTSQSGGQLVYLLTPVPEPSSLMLATWAMLTAGWVVAPWRRQSTSRVPLLAREGVPE